MSELKFIDVHTNLGNRLAAHFSAKSVDELAEIEAEAGINRMVVASWNAAVNLDLDRWNTLLFEQARGRADTRVWLTLHPLFSESLILLDSYAAVPEIAGVRLHPQTGRYLPQCLDTFELAERVASYRLPLLINVEMGSPSAGVENARKLADAFPDMPVIAAHMGVAEGFHSGVDAVKKSRHGNLFLETSAMEVLYWRYLEHCVNRIGADRILFGTNAPLFDPRIFRFQVETSSLTDNQKERIAWRNAEEVFRWRG